MLKNALNTDIENIYNNQINFFSQQKTLPIKYRREVLKKLLFSIRENEKKFMLPSIMIFVNQDLNH